MPIYDATLPYPATWPATAAIRRTRAGGARIAVQFVLNYEEGGENSVLHGDPGSEQFLSEMFNPASYPDRHLPWRASSDMARAPASGASCASSRSGGCR